MLITKDILICYSTWERAWSQREQRGSNHYFQDVIHTTTETVVVGLPTTTTSKVELEVVVMVVVYFYWVYFICRCLVIRPGNTPRPKHAEDLSGQLLLEKESARIHQLFVSTVPTGGTIIWHQIKCSSTVTTVVVCKRKSIVGVVESGPKPQLNHRGGCKV